MSQDSYKLYYFSFKGRAEPIRLIFALAQVPFEEVAFPYSEWNTWKSKFPWGQVPVLEVTQANGEKFVLAQSNAICRFLARKFNLTGANIVEEAKCNELTDAINDYAQEWQKISRFPENDPKRAETRETCLNVHTPYYLSRFSDIKAKNPGKWLVGAEITWADIYISVGLSGFEERTGVNLLEKYPLLQEFQREVSNVPSIKQFLATRKV